MQMHFNMNKVSVVSLVDGTEYTGVVIAYDENRIVIARSNDDKLFININDIKKIRCPRKQPKKLVL